MEKEEKKKKRNGLPKKAGMLKTDQKTVKKLDFELLGRLSLWVKIQLIQIILRRVDRSTLESYLNKLGRDHF